MLSVRWACLVTPRAEGAPFQMPAGLAVGLGLESGLNAVFPALFAPPRLDWPGYSGPPRPASGRKPDLGCWPRGKHERANVSTSFLHQWHRDSNQPRLL